MVNRPFPAVAALFEKAEADMETTFTAALEFRRAEVILAISGGMKMHPLHVASAARYGEAGDTFETCRPVRPGGGPLAGPAA